MGAIELMSRSLSQSGPLAIACEIIIIGELGLTCRARGRFGHKCHRD